MAIIQTPSIAAVVEDQNPQLANDLDCNDHVLQDVGGVNWFDSSVEYTANVQFGSTLYFQPSTGSGYYLFRGSSSTRSLEHRILSSEIITYVGSSQSILSWRGQNASTRFRFRAGSGGNVNMEIGTDYLELKDGTDPFTQYVYNTYTDSTNYERLEIGWDSDVATIITTADGTGTARDLVIGDAGAGNANIEIESNQITLRSGNTDKFRIGTGYISAFAALVPAVDSDHNLGLTNLRWENTYTDSITIGDGVDAILTADGDNELALRNGTDSQSFSVYKTYTDASSYERLFIGWSGTTSVVQPEHSNGNERGLRIGNSSFTNPAYMTFSTNDTIKFYSGGINVMDLESSYILLRRALRTSSDSAFDIGQSATKWRRTFTDSLHVGDGFNAVVTADADHELALRDGTDPQKLSVYNTYTDASNYERLEIEAAGGAYEIKAEADGTGSTRPITIDSNQVNIKYQGGNRLRIGSSSMFTYVPMTPNSDGATSSGTNATRWDATYTKAINTDVTTITASTYACNSFEHTLLGDCTSNAITITLPGGSDARSGRIIVIKKIDSSANAITIDPEDAAETIDGAASATISSQYDALKLTYDGSDWFII